MCIVYAYIYINTNKFKNLVPVPIKGKIYTGGVADRHSVTAGSRKYPYT